MATNPGVHKEIVPVYSYHYSDICQSGRFSDRKSAISIAEAFADGLGQHVDPGALIVRPDRDFDDNESMVAWHESIESVCSQPISANSPSGQNGTMARHFWAKLPMVRMRTLLSRQFLCGEWKQSRNIGQSATPKPLERPRARRRPAACGWKHLHFPAIGKSWKTCPLTSHPAVGMKVHS